MKKIFYYFLRQVLYAAISPFVHKTKLTFIQYDTRDSYGNIAMLYEKMKVNKKIYKIYGDSKNIIEEIKNIYLIAKSSVIVVEASSQYISQINPSKKTTIVFIGHGGGAYKKMAFSAIASNATEQEKKRVQRVSGKYTYVLCTSDSLKKFIANNYNIETSHVIPLGLPRTDIYYDVDIKKEKSYFLQLHPETKNKKLILYSPTFRTQKKNRILPQLLNETFFPDNFYDHYSILFRSHPTIEKINIPPQWINVTEMPLNSVLAISDIMISDFSSIIFDYSFFNRPIILFIPDYDEFEKGERSLWISPQELVTEKNYCVNTQCVVDRLEKSGPSQLWNSYMDACDGNCCAKISKFLLNLLGEDNL